MHCDGLGAVLALPGQHSVPEHVAHARAPRDARQAGRGVMQVWRATPALLECSALLQKRSADAPHRSGTSTAQISATYGRFSRRWWICAREPHAALPYHFLAHRCARVRARTCASARFRYAHVRACSLVVAPVNALAQQQHGRICHPLRTSACLKIRRHTALACALVTVKLFLPHRNHSTERTFISLSSRTGIGGTMWRGSCST